MKRGFTLIELLIVVGILSVLSASVLIVLDPVELLGQSRDSNRVNDLRTLERAIALAVHLGGADDSTEAQRVYLSLPDTNGDDRCLEYIGLPALPSGWEYRCRAEASSLRNVDGSGWLPINFDSSTELDSPLKVLPVNPTNTLFSYYAYAQGEHAGDYFLFTSLESAKYQNLAAADGGASALFYETAPIVWKRPWWQAGFGPKSVFAAVEVQQTRSVMLTTDTFVTVYSDMANGAFATAVVGKIQPDRSVTYGAPVVFNPRNSAFFSVARLDANRFVVAYNDGVMGPLGSAIIGTVNGTNITFGPNRQFNNWAVGHTSVAVLDPTHIVVTYQDHSPPGPSPLYHGTAAIGVIGAGDDIAFGPKRVFNAAYTELTSVNVIDAANFLVFYKDRDAGNQGEVRIGTVTGGNDISYATAPVVFQGAPVGNVSSVRLDASHYLVAYSAGAGWNGAARIVEVSGSTITLGGEYVFNAAATDHVSAAALGEKYFVAAYYDGGNSGYGTMIIGSVNEDEEIDYGSEYIFNDTGNVYYCSAAAIERDAFVVSYRDNTSNLKYGTAIVGYSAE